MCHLAGRKCPMQLDGQVDCQPVGISISYMALAIHAGRGAAVLQLTNKHCKERVVTHLYSVAAGGLSQRLLLPKQWLLLFSATTDVAATHNATTS
eukprot:jgi/Chrzof1/15003/Cz09g23250.t1